MPKSIDNPPYQVISVACALHESFVFIVIRQFRHEGIARRV